MFQMQVMMEGLNHPRGAYWKYLICMKKKKNQEDESTNRFLQTVMLALLQSMNSLMLRSDMFLQ